MRYRILGKTGIRVSEIGFGSWAISGRGYGSTIDSVSIDVLNHALEQGINFIDTADSYGNGHSEELIGKVLSERNDNDTTICTKFGWDFYHTGGIRSMLSRDYIKFAVEKSLERLKKDTIDIYLIHSQDPGKILYYDVHSSLDKLKREGKIRHFGLSVSDFYLLEYLPLIQTLDWDVVELTYNLLDRRGKELLFEPCSKMNIGIIIKEPLGCGILTGKYTISSVFDRYDHRNGWSREYLEKRISKANRIKNELSLTNSEMIKTSIRYILNNVSVSTVIPGVKNIDQLKENISSIDHSIDKNVISWIGQN